MDEDTLKQTLKKLEEHSCIELIPEMKPSGKKRITYDDTRIMMKRGLKILDDNYIEFYYSAARAVIAKQITQREFKVFLCIVHNMKQGKSCTYDALHETLGFDVADISKAVANLEKAQCINVFKRLSEDTGKNYNWYRQVHTTIYDELTDTYEEYVDMELPINGKRLEQRNKDKEETVVELLA